MLAVKNLLRNPIRSGLTVLGVAMGIAMLVSVSGYGNSIGSQLQNAVTNRYQLILQSRGVSSPLSSNISEADLHQIRAIDGIDEAQPVVIGSIRTDKMPYFLLIGVASKTALTGNIALIDGLWNVKNSNEIILGHNAAKRLQLGLNDQVGFQQLQFKVTGKFASESNILNHAGITNMLDAQELLGKQGKLNVILLKLDASRGIKTISRKLSTGFPHLLLTRSADLLGRLELFIVIERVTTALGLIAIVFCILIVMNTLLMSLSERKREIGILMAIGWSRLMIARTLLLESLIISIVGSVLGIIIGAYVLYFYSQSDIPGINWGTPELSGEIVFIALNLSAVIAVLSSIYPIIVSSRFSPSQILQRE